MPKQEDVTSSIADLEPFQQKQVVMQAAAKLSPQDQKEVAQSLAPPPTGRAINYLWLIVVSAFSLVLVASFITLALAVFHDKPATPAASAELILTTFTSAVGFLAGLFVPSPAGKNG